MSQQKHDIDPWFMPDDEKVLANEAETEHAEEHGELPDEPLCPHCGKPYREEIDGSYIHVLVQKEVGHSLDKRKVWKPAVVCSPNVTRRKEHPIADTDVLQVLES